MITQLFNRNFDIYNMTPSQCEDLCDILVSEGACENELALVVNDVLIYNIFIGMIMKDYLLKKYLINIPIEI